MRVVLYIEYDEDVLDAKCRSFYDANEQIPGEPRPGRQLILDLIEEAKNYTSVTKTFNPEFPEYGRGTITATVLDR